jgi:tetratricopeptide (TPR) repeat protein
MMKSSAHWIRAVAGLWIALGSILPSCSKEKTPDVASIGCRDCHEKYYQRWSASGHGLAIQAYTADLAQKHFSSPTKPIRIGKTHSEGNFEIQDGSIRERGGEGEKRYEIRLVMGGRNIFYFLSPLDRGRLQVLPLAYDVKQKTWYDATAKPLPHSIDPGDEGPLIFHSLCYRCHVNQLSLPYDMKTDRFHFLWNEPGIHCEACHGPVADHLESVKAAPKGKAPADLKVIRWKNLTPEQKNDACASCHSKMRPITSSFSPGERFFDHFDLITLEDPDFFADGRDRGNHFTLTQWRMSPCVKSGKLDCTHCHTSGGDYRFPKPDEANRACLPCHAERVQKATAHTRHGAESPGNRCVACHMPQRESTLGRRSDHSMLPPAPTASIRLQSPNACNLCHPDRDPQWADDHVRRWHRRDYQAPVLYRAGLIDAARKKDWSRLPEMLRYIIGKNRDEIVAASLIRLLDGCPRMEKWPALIQALEDPSPLIRSAAAEALEFYPGPEAQGALLKALADEFRLVRVKAAMALSRRTLGPLSEADRKRMDRAAAEYRDSLLARPDLWSSHFHLGNYDFQRGDWTQALEAYERALHRNPQSVPVLIKIAAVQTRLGKREEAEKWLRKALEIDPKNIEAKLSLDLLRGEEKKPPSVEKPPPEGREADSRMAAAAYDLGLLQAKKDLQEAIAHFRKAYELQPDNPKYGYTLAFYLNEKGDAAGAARILQEVVNRQTDFGEAYLLLGEIYTKQGRGEMAAAVYLRALRSRSLSEADRARIGAKLKELAGPRG